MYNYCMWRRRNRRSRTRLTAWVPSTNKKARVGQNSSSCHHPGNETQLKPRGAGARRTCGEKLKNIYEEQCSETKDVKKPEVCTPISKNSLKCANSLLRWSKPPTKTTVSTSCSHPFPHPISSPSMTSAQPARVKSSSPATSADE